MFWHHDKLLKKDLTEQNTNACNLHLIRDRTILIS